MIHLLMLKVPFSFLLKLNSHYAHMFTSPFQKTLKQNHLASHNYYSGDKNMLKFLALKLFLKELLLETEWSEIMLIWWFVSVKFIRSFLKFSFKYIPLNYSPWNFNFTRKIVPFASTEHHYGGSILFTFSFFSQKGTISFFLLLIVLIRL